MELTEEAIGHSSRILLHRCESQGFLFFQFLLSAASDYSQTDLRQQHLSGVQEMGIWDTHPRTLLSSNILLQLWGNSAKEKYVQDVYDPGTVHLPTYID